MADRFEVFSRRKVLTGSIGAVSMALAGCAGSADDDRETESKNSTDAGDGDGSDDVDEPEAVFSESDTDEIMLEESDFPEDWKRGSEEMNSGDFTHFHNADETRVVGIYPEIYETVADADKGLDSAESKFSEVNELDIGDRAFWGKQDGAAWTILRVSNAEVQVIGQEFSGYEWAPSVGLSTTYAEMIAEDLESMASSN